MTSKNANDILWRSVFAIQLELVMLVYLLFQTNWSKGWARVDESTAFSLVMCTMFAVLMISSIGLFAPMIVRIQDQYKSARIGSIIYASVALAVIAFTTLSVYQLFCLLRYAW